MDREAFEQLVSAWLDEPQRTDLRQRIEQAVARHPELAGLPSAYQRLDALLRRPPDLPVDWSAFRARVAAAVDRALEPSETEAAWDARLRAALPDPEARVDWDAARRRFSSAVARAERSGSRPAWRLPLVAASLAAAAAVVLWFARPAQEIQSPMVPAPAVRPVARAEVTPPPGCACQERAGSVARLTIYEDPVLAAVADPVRTGPDLDEDDPEVYFMLEPPEPTLAVASADGF